jgi:hypothetical protein
LPLLSINAVGFTNAIIGPTPDSSFLPATAAVEEGIAPGAGVALLRAAKVFEHLQVPATSGSA